MAQSVWPCSPLDTELGRSASPVYSRPTINQETEGGGVPQSLIERPAAPHAIIPEDPILPDPDDEIIDDPSWDDEIIRDPDPLEPPVEEPPPGWGA